MNYHRIPIKKAVVYLTGDEINSLLMKDIALYKQALKRSKAFERHNQLNSRIEQKRLDDL
jgi:hypothetical protein